LRTCSVLVRLAHDWRFVRAVVIFVSPPQQILNAEPVSQIGLTVD